jgi:kanamycin kinase
MATLSLGWNYPGGVWDTEFFAAFFAAHGVGPDTLRIDCYRRLRQPFDIQANPSADTSR